MRQIALDERINFKGNVMTFQEFIDTYAGGDPKHGKDVFEVLVRKGHMKFFVGKPDKQELTMQKANKEEIIKDIAEDIDLQEESMKDHQAELKREGRLSYEEIEIAYSNVFRAQDAENMYRERLRLKDTEIKIKDNIVYLVIRNVSDTELAYINRTYTADNVIRGGVNLIGKGADGAVNAIDYTAKKIVTPVFEIGARTGMGLLRALTGTVVKTGATVVNAGSQSVKQTAYDIKHDPDIIKARREIINAKDDIRRTIVNHTSGTASGVRIVK